MRLAFHIGELGDAGLHAEGHFILCDTGLDFRVAHDLMSFAIERGEVVEHISSHGAIHPVWIGEIEYRVAGVSEFHARVLG